MTCPSCILPELWNSHKTGVLGLYVCTFGKDTTLKLMNVWAFPPCQAAQTLQRKAMMT